MRLVTGLSVLQKQQLYDDIYTQRGETSIMMCAWRHMFVDNYPGLVMLDNNNHAVGMITFFLDIFQSTQCVSIGEFAVLRPGNTQGAQMLILFEKLIKNIKSVCFITIPESTSKSMVFWKTKGYTPSSSNPYFLYKKVN